MRATTASRVRRWPRPSGRTISPISLVAVPTRSLCWKRRTCALPWPPAEVARGNGAKTTAPRSSREGLLTAEGRPEFGSPGWTTSVDGPAPRASDEMRLGLRRAAYRSQYARALHHTREAAGGIRPRGPAGRNLQAKCGRPPGPRMLCGWRCGARLTASQTRAHFTIAHIGGMATIRSCGLLPVLPAIFSNPFRFVDKHCRRDDLIAPGWLSPARSAPAMRT